MQVWLRLRIPCYKASRNQRWSVPNAECIAVPKDAL